MVLRVHIIFASKIPVVGGYNCVFSRVNVVSVLLVNDTLARTMPPTPIGSVHNHSIH